MEIRRAEIAPLELLMLDVWRSLRGPMSPEGFHKYDCWILIEGLAKLQPLKPHGTRMVPRLLGNHIFCPYMWGACICGCLGASGLLGRYVWASP